MIQKDCRLVSKETITSKYILLTLESPALARSALPGQFVMVRIPGERFFLRRPFSILSVNKDTFNILFKVVGIGTEVLSRQEKDKKLNLIGPLGNGYPFPSVHRTGTAPFILIAGGTGIASLFFLAGCLRAHNKKTPSLFLIGAKTKKEIILKKELEGMGFRVLVSTEDGNMGTKGFVTDILKEKLSAGHIPKASILYSCGPRLMLKKVAELASRKRLQCFVSLEEHMACGIGVCMGCAVRTKDRENPYQRACTEGPVFNAREIVWD